MKSRISGVRHLLTAILCVGLAVPGASRMEALAATKPINSVSVRITSKLETGSHLPDIGIEGGTPPDGGITVRAGNSRYTVAEAEWAERSSSYTLEAASDPQMRVLLEPTDVGEDYFLASYRESDVTISGGTFVSARRDGDNLLVTLRVRPVKGNFDPPKDAYWNEDNLGEARWEASENDSGYYQVKLYRDEKSVFTVEKTSSRSCNFYPYMTQAGSYTFEVRCIPGTDLQKEYGKNSDYVESGDLVITDRYVSDGKGQGGQAVQGSTGAVGWVKEGDVWHYRYPNGSLCRGDWALVDGLWYYFDTEGTMCTGWQVIGGQYYYFWPSGQMASGWSSIDGKWYYFRPETEGTLPAGSMVSGGWRVIGPYYYYFNADGSMYTGWLSYGGKWYYLNTLANSLEGVMFTGFFDRDGNTYYTDANGAMAEGWWQIDGNWRYFYPGSGQMARDTYIDSFYIDPDGIWRQ